MIDEIISGMDATAVAASPHTPYRRVVVLEWFLCLLCQMDI